MWKIEFYRVKAIKKIDMQGSIAKDILIWE